MRNDAFQNANSVFTGVLRDNKEKGFDVGKPKSSISQADIDKLYEQYFIPGLAAKRCGNLTAKSIFRLSLLHGQKRQRRSSKSQEGVLPTQKNGKW